MSVAVTDAVFFAAAAVFRQVEQDMIDQQASTFYTQSPVPIIDLLGDERSTPRIPGQSDASYDSTVQNCLFRNVGEAELLTLINAQLNNGAAFMIENEQYGYYDDPDTSETAGFLYYDDQWSIWLSGQKNYNWWTVSIPLQTGGVQATMKANVISVIELNKALGTTYDVIWNTTGYYETEDGSNQFTDESGNTLQTEI